jgi:hypothetical protein
VDSHLEGIPGLGSFTAGCLSGGDLEGLGRETNGALDAEFFALGTLDELLADLLEGLDFAGGQGDADLVGFLSRMFVSRNLGGAGQQRTNRAFAELLLWLLIGHFSEEISFTTRTFQLRQSDEGDRCVLRCRWGTRDRRDLDNFGVVGGKSWRGD